MSIVVNSDKFLTACIKFSQSSGTQKALDFAEKLMKFDSSTIPGVSVDDEEMQNLGSWLHFNVRYKNWSDALKAIKSVLSLTRSGGGELFTEAQQVFSTIQQLMPKPKPVRLIPAAQYNLLGQLAQVLKDAKSMDTTKVQGAKDKFSEMKPQLDDTQNVLQFMDAMATTEQNSQNVNEKYKGKYRAKEIAMFKQKMDNMKKELESVFVGFAGAPREVEGPSLT